MDNLGHSGHKYTPVVWNKQSYYSAAEWISQLRAQCLKGEKWGGGCERSQYNYQTCQINYFIVQFRV